ncbi:MAG TPA: hypothetical protein VLV48_10170 [Thermoanaerobaculia bacterium]|nr:hypothetical protein [Thermoanaerobaculia bacterium]
MKTTTIRKSVAKLPVTEGNIKKAALRLLSQKLVSTEVYYIQHVLGNRATQEDIDTNVLAVRKLPWASIVLGD